MPIPRRRSDYCPHRSDEPDDDGLYSCVISRSHICPNPTYRVSQCAIVNPIQQQLGREQDTTQQRV